MTYVETLNKMQNELTLDQQNAYETYFVAEQNLVTSTSQYIMNAKVTCATYGDGQITAIQGDTFDLLVVDITFAEVQKRFSLVHIITHNFIKFVDELIYEPLNIAMTIHNDLTIAYREYELMAKRAALAAAKKAEADKQAEVKYKERKEKALKDFEFLSNKHYVSSTDDEFYYALGWLIKHIGTVSAVLPDYLEPAFTKHFGPDIPCRIVDSKKKSPAGWQPQWSWSFTISIKKPDDVPVALVPYLNPAGKVITNTSFVWELIDNYGFQFGKKQDLEKITQAIPVNYVESFKAGLIV